MRSISFAVLSAALVVAAPAAAQSADDRPSAKPAAEKKICKKLTVTGSRMAERICLTREEWKQVEELK